VGTLPTTEEQFWHLLHVKNDAFAFLDRPPCITTGNQVYTSRHWHFDSVETTSGGTFTMVAPAKTMTPSAPSIGCSSDIRCYHFHGIGHMQQDYLSQWAYITTDNGCCIRTSDVEDKVATNDNGHTLLVVLILQHTST
jgi:hypothetical protein